MEKQTFIDIINAVVDFVSLSDKFNNLLECEIEFGIHQMYQIVEALESEFEDHERWISWWVFDAGENKVIEYKSPTQVTKYYKEVYEAESQSGEINLSTAGELYDFLDWNRANS